MNNMLSLILRILKFLRRIGLKIRGMNENDLHVRRVVTGKAWDDFCDQLKASGAALMYPGTPRDGFNQAEGMRYLTRLTRAGLEAFVEFSDPSFPVFRRMVHETVKMGADNPDNHYFNAQISGEHEYRIYGKRNSVHYIGFFTQNGNYGTTGGLEPCGKLEHTDLKVSPDGSFEIVVSKVKKGVNWLKTEDRTGLVIVRQTFLDHLNEVPAELYIENLDGRTTPDPVTPAMIDEGLKTASLFISGAPLLFARWAHDFQKHTNTLPLFDPGVSNRAGGDPAILYYHSHWKLAADEALVIDVKPPDCDSWNFQLNNYWMESLDYRYFNVCINKSSAVYNPDDSVRIVIAHKDPGIPNWINTCHHTEGTMCWRWYRLAPGEQPVQPECRIVKFPALAI
jgi:hypothetical protein